MKKRFRVSTALLAAVLLAGCGSISSKNGDGGYYSVNEAASADAAYDSAAGAANSSIVPEELPDSTDETSQKISYNADINIESTDFDAARDTLLAAVDDCGAWMEYSSLSGDAKDHDRYAYYTVRVPVENYRTFLAAVGEAGSVLDLSETAENITSSYIDVQARLSALEAQRDRLNELADQAETTADLLEIESQLSDVPAAIRMSRATLRNIHENLFWAFFYNVIGIPLAAGVWIPIFGWTLNRKFGAAAMSLSSFCVVTNGLRLNSFKIHDAVKDKKVKNPVSIESNSGNIADFSEASSAVFSKSFNADKTSDAEQTINNSCKLLNECSDINNNTNKKENNTMVKVTVNVTGMMCGHCEAHVNKAIQEAFGVQDVVSSHDAGTTIFSAPEKVDEDKIRQVIKDAGYEVTGITQE